MSCLAVSSLLALLEEMLHSRLSHIKQLYGLKGLDLRFFLEFESDLRRNLLAEPFSFLGMTFTIELKSHPINAFLYQIVITYHYENNLTKNIRPTDIYQILLKI